MAIIEPCKHEFQVLSALHSFAYAECDKCGLALKFYTIAEILAHWFSQRKPDSVVLDEDGHIAREQLERGRLRLEAEIWRLCEALAQTACGTKPGAIRRVAINALIYHGRRDLLEDEHGPMEGMVADLSVMDDPEAMAQMWRDFPPTP
jgi:hypothetical protein